MTEVKNKWALVTGGARGIGALAAMFLAERGCNLIIQSRNKTHNADIEAKAIAKGVSVYSVECDLNNPESVQKMLREIDGFGVDVDFVLNNAGLQVTYRNEYLDTPVEDFTESFMVNTISPAMICYHFLPKMKAKGFGRIVNTTSGIDKEPQQAGYSASKAALDKFTKDLATTVDGTDVMINLTDPGWCRTDLGGPKAPFAPEDALPGVVLGVFADDKKSGRLFAAPNYHKMDLETALKQL
jgi:NAD(P)-dependent dehydrogenase (short-subunit alcohol dehydrogenase family)